MASTASTKQPVLLRKAEDYTIGVICSQPFETDAVHAMFDYYVKPRDRIERAPGDDNAYSFGIIGQYHVVVAQLGEMGKIESSGAATDMKRSFPNIRLCLVVGVCSVIPKIKDQETLLGDVVVSTMVKQYDLVRQYEHKLDTKTEPNVVLRRPPPILRNFFKVLTTLQGTKDFQEELTMNLTKLLHHENMTAFGYPGYHKDHLYRPSCLHEHKHQECSVCAKNQFCEAATGATCEQLGCPTDQLMLRARVANMEILHAAMNAAEGEHKAEIKERLLVEMSPKLILGNVASGDRVIKSGSGRDQIAKEHGIVAFEMAAAGVWDTFPTVCITGACDYGDSHNNKYWEKYAAATAAASAKAFLELFNEEGNVKYSTDINVATAEVVRHTAPSSQAGPQFNSINSNFKVLRVLQSPDAACSIDSSQLQPRVYVTRPNQDGRPDPYLPLHRGVLT
ncbi:hypothetical protein H2198_003118 [Neophaeococcomyces mojaviensis]|uniref:Uncharacterized protein n=1 Tax=Neophaeococcomyces mojaviensis TaxID=3383035 RepID=A0ACC3ACL6_9EURO|nr:hypothetical protein H2198_003118 [Knufia sp. JES_112]